MIMKSISSMKCLLADEAGINDHILALLLQSLSILQVFLDLHLESTHVFLIQIKITCSFDSLEVKFF